MVSLTSESLTPSADSCCLRGYTLRGCIFVGPILYPLVNPARLPYNHSRSTPSPAGLYQVCQPVLPSLGPQALEACVWSIGVQHPEGAPQPSQYLNKQLAACFSKQLKESSVTVKERAAGSLALDQTITSAAAVPVAPEPPLTPLQIVHMISVLGRLGVGEHSQGVTSLICAALEVRLSSTSHDLGTSMKNTFQIPEHACL